MNLWLRKYSLYLYLMITSSIRRDPAKDLHRRELLKNSLKFKKNLSSKDLSREGAVRHQSVKDAITLKILKFFPLKTTNSFKLIKTLRIFPKNCSISTPKVKIIRIWKWQNSIRVNWINKAKMLIEWLRKARGLLFLKSQVAPNSPQNLILVSNLAQNSNRLWSLVTKSIKLRIWTQLTRCFRRMWKWKSISTWFARRYRSRWVLGRLSEKRKKWLSS